MGGYASTAAFSFLFTQKSAKYMMPGACFVAGTLIATPSGMREIQYLAEGDTVYTYNISSGQIEEAIIPNIFARNSQEFIKLYVAGDTIVCTPEHPFFINNTWMKVGEL